MSYNDQQLCPLEIVSLQIEIWLSIIIGFQQVVIGKKIAHLNQVNF